MKINDDIYTNHLSAYFYKLKIYIIINLNLSEFHLSWGIKY